MRSDRTEIYPVEIDISDPDWASGVFKLQRKSYRIEADLIHFQAIPPLIESQEQLSRSIETFFVTGAPAELSAMIAIEHDDVETLTISRLCVNPDFMRQGLASALIHHILKLFPEKKLIKVSTGAANQPAIDCYVKAGFSVHRYEKLEKHELRIVHLTLKTGPVAP